MALLLGLVACSDAGDAGTGGEPVTLSTTGQGAASSQSSAANGAGGSGGGGGGASGGGGSSYVPDPIPAIDPEPPPPCPEDTPSGYFQFLDESCGARRVPSHADRGLACPSVDTSAEIVLRDGETVSYRSSAEPLVVEDVLADVPWLPDGLQLTVILIRRIDGVPHYRYLSNGSAYASYQPWSTTKFLAAANAASYLRIASDYSVGLTASVAGHRLGDLVTSVHNYDYAPFSSNALGAYFHDIGGRARANDLVHGLWLERPASESFGGNYGAAPPALGYSFSDGDASVTIAPDTSSGPANHLSSFTTAEALKRLVLHREEAEQRLPGIQWADVETLLYGAEGSSKYGDWGGMTADTAIYLQSSHDIDYLETRSHGRWRVFSKLGLGTSGQFLDVGYGCFPVLDDDDEPVPGWGREVVVAAHLPTGGGSWAERDRMLAKAYRELMIRVVDGTL